MDKPSDDPLYLDTSIINDIDVLIYSFMNINEDFTINIPDDFSNNVFFNNDLIKIISFGGWDFSTDPSTYHIFRDLVSNQNNINTFVNSLQNLLNNYDLDGIDLDWEYPGAPDIPGIPADDPDNGQNYLNLIKAIKNNIPDKSVSITIPSSYWYAKTYPITDIQNVVDFMTVMTYDLYGQWDYGKPDTGLICHTDRSKISDTIKMLNKAGVDFSKLNGGIANYARTYEMNDPNCEIYPCGYTGPASGAQPGNFTKTPGIMSEDELILIENSGVDKTWIDNDSQCTYMIYYNNNWAAWSNVSQRVNNMYWFANMGMSGIGLWAVNYDNANYDLDDLFDYSSECKANIYTENSYNYLNVSCSDYIFEDILKRDNSGSYDQEAYEYQIQNSIKYSKINEKDFKNLECPDIDDEYINQYNYLYNLTNIMKKNQKDYKYIANRFEMSMEIEKSIVSKILKIQKANLNNYDELRKRNTPNNKNNLPTLCSLLSLNIITSRLRDLLDYVQYAGNVGMTNEIRSLFNNDELTYIDYVLNYPNYFASEQQFIQQEEDTEQTVITQDDLTSILDEQIRRTDRAPILEINEENYPDTHEADQYVLYSESMENSLINSQYPVYIVNINNQSPGVALNALTYLRELYDIDNSIFENTNGRGYLVRRNRNGPSRYSITGRFLPSGRLNDNGLNYNMGPITYGHWQLDEFPFNSINTNDLDTLDRNVLEVEQSDNWIDGQNLNRFYQGYDPGISTREVSELYVENDWTYIIPNNPNSRRRGTVNNNNNFIILINLEDIASARTRIGEPTED